MIDMHYLVRKYHKKGKLKGMIVWETDMTEEEVEQIKDKKDYDYVFIKMKGKLRKDFIPIEKC